MTVADDSGDSRECGEFVGRTLSIAAGGDDARFRIEAVGPADEGAGFAIGFGSDRTGIDDDHVGFGGRALGGSFITQEGGYGFAVGAGGTTAEVLDVEGRGHRVSLLN